MFYRIINLLFRDKTRFNFPGIPAAPDQVFRFRIQKIDHNSAFIILVSVRSAVSVVRVAVPTVSKKSRAVV